MSTHDTEKLAAVSDDIMPEDSRMTPNRVQPFSATIMREERAQA
jgi:hypothetical protein